MVFSLQLLLHVQRVLKNLLGFLVTEVVCSKKNQAQKVDTINIASFEGVSAY